MDGFLGSLDPVANDLARENVHDGIETIDDLAGTAQHRDVPTPQLVRCAGGVDRLRPFGLVTTALGATVSVLPVCGHHSVSRRCGEWHLSRSEEHTSELQSRFDLVCRLMLEK